MESKSILSLEELLTINLWEVLQKHKIDVDFAVKHILFSRYEKTESEKCIDCEDILFLQPHISRKALDHAICQFRREWMRSNPVITEDPDEHPDKSI